MKLFLFSFIVGLYTSIVSLSKAKENVFMKYGGSEYLEEAMMHVKALKHHNSTCVGLGLAYSCGDGVCDVKKHETIANCPEDCAPGWKPYSKQQGCPTSSQVVTPFSIDEAVHFVKQAAAVGSPLKACGAGHTIGSYCCTEGVQVYKLLYIYLYIHLYIYNIFR
jgi:hypothetical protein